MQEKEKTLTARQLSLVFQVSEKTIKKLAENGDLPCTYSKNKPEFKLNEIINRFRQLEGSAA
jgi:hypothetical protein